MPADVRAAVRAMVGKTVTRMTRWHYWADGEIDRSHGALEIDFGPEVLHLTMDIDQSSLRVVDGPSTDYFPDPLSPTVGFVETEGRNLRVDVSEEERYADFIGQPIEGVALLRHEYGWIAGARLWVPARSLWFVVGAELFVEWARPSSCTEEAA